MIREIQIEDTKKLLLVMKQIDAESKYMLFEAGERKTNEEQLRKRIESIQKQKNAVIFAAEEEEEIVGYIMALGGTVQKNKHSAYIVVGIIEKFCGKGIGTKLFEAVEQWAKQTNITRLELTVITENAPAFSLYKKMGFEQEGIKRRSIKMNDEYYDEYYLSKLL